LFRHLFGSCEAVPFESSLPPDVQVASKTGQEEYFRLNREPNLMDGRVAGLKLLAVW